MIPPGYLLVVEVIPTPKSKKQLRSVVQIHVNCSRETPNLHTVKLYGLEALET